MSTSGVGGAVDIREGDLIKATRKDFPEEAVTGRVVTVGEYHVTTKYRSITRRSHDFEVLDRPLPPIDEELLEGAADAYREGKSDRHTITNNGEAIIAVINFVRKYDAEHNNKESK